MKQAFIAKPNLLDEIAQQPVPHSDFVTPEYTQFKEIHPKKWEMTRGIGHSFGYNRNERDEDYASSGDALVIVHRCGIEERKHAAERRAPR